MIQVNFLTKSRQASHLLTRHLLKEIFPPCLITFAVLTILVFCQQLSRNSELFFSPLISWKAFLQILTSLLPPIFTFTLPVAIAVGEVLALSRLATDHEWVALEAGGLKRINRFGPFIFVGVLGFVLLLTLNWSFTPQAIARVKEIRNVLLTGNMGALIRPEAFIAEIPGLLLKVKAIDPRTKIWDGVLLFRKDETSSNFQLLAAKSGSLIPINNNFDSFEIKLSNGIFIDNLLSVKDHITSVFDENTIKIDKTKRPTQEQLSDISSPVQLMTMSDLFSRVQHSQAGNVLVRNEATFEIFKRFSNAFASIFASLCAIVLTSLLHGRSAKRLVLIFISFLLLAAYYVALIFGQQVILKGKVTENQGMLLAISIPFLFLAILHWIATNKLFTIQLNFSQCIISRKKSNKKSTYNIFNFDNTGIPSFNIGHYLIISEFVKLLILSLIILTSTILLFTLLDIAPSIARNNIEARFAVGYLLRLSPQIIYYVAPFGILVAVVAAATSLTRTGQLTLLLYYSASPLRLALPLIIGTFLVFLSILFLSDTILPISNREQDNRYRKIKGKTMEEATVTFGRQWISRESTNTIYGFQFLDENNKQKLSVLTIKLTNPIYFLNEVIYIDSVGEVQSSSDTSLAFRYKIGMDGLAEFTLLQQNDLPSDLQNREILSERTYREASKLTYKQLQTYISQVEKTGLPTTGLQMEKMQKLAFPFACITLLFLAFPICLLQIQRQYQSRFSSIGISIGLALLFWGILSIFEAAGKRGALPILIAAWAPHALFLALASSIQLKTTSLLTKS